jgi:hypothetical protein
VIRHHYDMLLDEWATACGVPIRLIQRAEYTKDPLSVDCPLCHDNPEFDELLARAEYAPEEIGRLSWRQSQALNALESDE